MQLNKFNYRFPLSELKEEPKAGVKNFLSSIENKQTKEYTQKAELDKPMAIPSNPLLGVISFLESLTYSYDDGRILVHAMNDAKQKRLQFLLLNPAARFQDVIQEARSVIVAGGTMKPMSEFRERLFKSAGAKGEELLEFSCGHIIPPENILPIILGKGKRNEILVFNFENRFSMVRDSQSELYFYVKLKRML